MEFTQGTHQSGYSARRERVETGRNICRGTTTFPPLEEFGKHDMVERKDKQTNKQQWRLKHISERRDLTSHQIYNICTYCSGNWTAFLTCVSYRVCGPEACCYVVLNILNPAHVLFLQRGHSNFCVNYDRKKKRPLSLKTKNTVITAFWQC